MKKIVLRISSLVISLMLILSLSGSTPVPQNMPAEEMSLEEIKSCPEAEEYMTEYADAYITSDETMTYVVDTEKIHYKDENGKWQDIDNTIVADSEWDYRNKANDLKMLFKSDDEGIVSRLEKERYSLQFRLLTDSSAEAVSSIDSKSNEYIENLNEKENVLFYETDEYKVAYTARAEMLKEDVILYEKPEFNKIEYIIETEGLEYEEEEREYTAHNEDEPDGEGIFTYTVKTGVFKNEEGKEIFEIGSFYMTDSSEKQCSIDWDINEAENKLILYLDEEFLGSAIYPVVIDPTVSGPSNTYDTYASRANPDTNYYLNNYLRTGKDDPYGIRRSFLKFNLPSIENKYPIKSAKIQIKLKSNSGSIGQFNYKRITTSWSSSAVTWWNSPDCESTEYHSTSVSNGILTIGGSDPTGIIPKIVRRWRVGLYPNYGIKLYYSNESSTSVWQTFYSSDYSDSSCHPKLIIEIYTGNSSYIKKPISDFYGGGTSGGNYFVLDGSELPVIYQSKLAIAVSRWNTYCSSSHFSIGTSNNKVKINNSIPGWGKYTPYSDHFLIEVSKTQIDQEKDWDDIIISVFEHEMGHALGLADNDDSSQVNPYRCTQMGYGRDRDTFLYPSNSDIYGVNDVWN